MKSTEITHTAIITIFLADPGQTPRSIAPGPMPPVFATPVKRLPAEMPYAVKSPLCQILKCFCCRQYEPQVTFLFQFRN